MLIASHGTPEIGTPEIGTPEIGTPEIGTPEIGTPEIGTPEIGTPEIGTLEVGTLEVGTLEIGTLEVGTPEIGTPEIGTPEIGTTEIGTLEIGTPEIGTPEIGTFPALITLQPQPMFLDYYFQFIDSHDAFLSDAPRIRARSILQVWFRSRSCQFLPDYLLQLVRKVALSHHLGEVHHRDNAVHGHGVDVDAAQVTAHIGVGADDLDREAIEFDHLAERCLFPIR